MRNENEQKVIQETEKIKDFLIQQHGIKALDFFYHEYRRDGNRIYYEDDYGQTKAIITHKESPQKNKSFFKRLWLYLK